MEPLETITRMQAADQTVLHPVALMVLLALTAATLMVQRRFALVPLIIMACAIPATQRISILTLDFTLVRVLVLVAAARILVRGEYTSFRWNAVDTAAALWSVSAVIAYTLLFGTVSAFVNRMGYLFDGVLIYLVCRSLIRSVDDLRQISISFALVSIPVAAAFCLEWATQRNLFAVFGGVSPITIEREGRLRCQGAFPHPILAGCFWAAVLPIVLSLAWNRPARSKAMLYLAVIGSSCSLLIIVACSSSTPLIGVACGLVAAPFYFIRNWMRLIRYGILATLIGLHLVMNAPVWHLLARVDAVGGSAGWHRYNLINQAVNRIGEWWFVGTKATHHWGHNLDDITNQYILEGVRGGLLTMCLFIVMIGLAFREVGRFVRRARSSHLRIVGWCIGCTLFMNVMMFLAVSYFGQVRFVWMLSLAMAGGLVSIRCSRAPEAASIASRRRARSVRQRRSPGLVGGTA